MMRVAVYARVQLVLRGDQGVLCLLGADASAFYLTHEDRNSVSGKVVKAEIGSTSLIMPHVISVIMDEASALKNKYVDRIFAIELKKLSCNPSFETLLFDALFELGQVTHDNFFVRMGQEIGVLTIGGSKRSMYL